MEQAIWRARGIPVATVIDVGASDGRWSRIARVSWPGARFLLFEANPYHEAGLKRNAMEYVLAAAGDVVGDAHFDATDPWGGVASHAKTGAGDIRVRMTTIDREVSARGYEGPYLLKLDTHGFEREILEGATRVLEGCSLLVIEAYNVELRPGSLRIHELVAYVETRGFRCLDLADPMHRPKDSMLWQVDLIFARADRPEFADNAY